MDLFFLGSIKRPLRFRRGNEHLDPDDVSVGAVVVPYFAFGTEAGVTLAAGEWGDVLAAGIAFFTPAWYWTAEWVKQSS